ncbi:uncharacterized protein TNCV_2648601 [Trichonephila clavipes]|nr:uncharacterized protein TNCV_2648601 [Trichonephila clavipes]
MASTVLLNQIADCLLHEIFQSGSNDLVTIHTLKYRILNDLMTKLDLTFQGLNQLINTHTPVDPEVAKVILRCTHKHDETILAQDFVKNERLNRLSGQANTTSTLLAIDGLIGPKLNNGPQFEYKKYIENLKYSLSGEQGRYDREEGGCGQADTYLCRTTKGSPTTEEESFIDFTSSGEIKGKFCNKTLFQFWAEVDDEFSELKTKAFRILLPFSTPYLCETGFSVVAALKTNYRSQLNIEK